MVFFIRNTKMIFAIELKRHVAGASIFGIIIGKFCHKKNPCLVILFEIDEGSKVGFYCTILCFGLTVYLWVEGGGKSLLDAMEKT